MTPTPMRLERRQRDRFSLPPMYSPVTVAPTSAPESAMTGHAYDISESGVRIELDDSLKPGDGVEMSIGLPGESVTIATRAEVVRVFDADDDPGPRRMGLRFNAFASDLDRQRLMGFFARHEVRRAA